MASMQQLMAQAQKMQRELKKAKDALAQKEYSVTKGGGVKVALLGNLEVVEVSVDDDLFDKDNKEMVEELLIIAFNECVQAIKKEEAAINEAITGSAAGLM